MEHHFMLRDVARFILVIFAFFVFCGCPKVDQERKSSELPAKQEPPRPEREVKFKLEQQIIDEPASAENATASQQKQSNSTSEITSDQEQELEQSEAAKGTEETSATDAAEEEENLSALEEMERNRDLGPPLVNHPENLRKVDPLYPVWIDVVNKQVVMVGEICQTEVPLEMFACLRGTKEHESIVAVATEAYIVHGALLAVGAKPGNPVQYYPNYAPATGSEIEISVRWKSASGEVQRARAQDWVRDLKTGRALDHPWVFAGSGFWRDEYTGKEYYKAEGGDFICVANFPDAMLDLPIRSSESNAELLFQAFTRRIPPRGTPVTLILTPRLEETETPIPEAND